MSIGTSEKPMKCKRCGSKRIGLELSVFKKDSNGEYTTIPILGTWMCDECGATIGRMVCEGCNEIYPESI